MTSMIEMAAELAAMKLPSPPTRENCDLCGNSPKPCIAHMTPADWDKAIKKETRNG